MNDIGKLVGRYFFVLGIFYFITIIIGFYQSKNIYIDFVPLILFFLGGQKLLKHNSKGRNGVIVFSGILLIISFIICIYTFFWGVPSSLRIWGYEITENTSTLLVYLLSLLTFAIFAVPYFLLKTEKAKKEFEN